MQFKIVKFNILTAQRYAIHILAANLSKNKGENKILFYIYIYIYMRNRDVKCLEDAVTRPGVQIAG